MKEPKYDLKFGKSKYKSKKTVSFGNYTEGWRVEIHLTKAGRFVGVLLTNITFTDTMKYYFKKKSKAEKVFTKGLKVHENRSSKITWHRWDKYCLKDSKKRPKK